MTGMKEVIATVEMGPNYVFHLLAVAGIGFRSEYGETYAHTVEPGDLAFLREHAGLLWFLDGRGGALAGKGVFAPAYLSLDTEHDFEKYFALACRGFLGEPGPFLARYGERLRGLNAWLDPMDEAYFAGVLALGPAADPVTAVFRELGAVYARNLATYAREVWPAERPALERLASHLNDFLRGRGIIGAWERLTGLPFLFAPYQIVLVSATANGPDMNSLGYDRNVFYAGTDFDDIVHRISHETGSHLLIDLVKQVGEPDPEGKVRLPADWHRPGATRSGGGGPAAADAPAAASEEEARPRYDFALFYRAYENLCLFYNKRLLGAPGLDYMGPSYEPERFCEVYGRLLGAEPKLTPAELIRRALEELEPAGR